MRIFISRSSEVQRLQRRLERDGFPRLQMLLLVTITGASGFLASFALFHAGLQAMSVRYLLACAIAYLVFLLLLWLWLRTKAEDYADIPDVGNVFPSSGNSGGEGACYSGEGGDFGGGGASASFDGAPAEASDSGGVAGEMLEGVGAADELAIPLVVLLALVALVLSSLYVVYAAPVLFAELMLDGMLAAGLYRRLKGIESNHWIETALRRTFWPFVLTALVCFIAGLAMGMYAPDAHTIGAVLQYHASQIGSAGFAPQ
ncbi:MAG: hypothetical protein WAW02_01125 [Sideroxyarcus sp.]